MSYEFEVRRVRRDGDSYEAEITFGLDLYENEDLLGEQVRNCVFRPAEPLQSSLADRVGEVSDTEFEIFNLSKDHVGLDDRPVGYVGKVRWKSGPDYGHCCC